MLTAQVAGYLAEQHVFNELLKRGLAVYKPLVHSGINGLVRLEDGRVIELEILSVGGVGGKDLGWFQIAEFQAKPNLFIICLAFVGDAVGETWVFPSAVYHAYATGEASKARVRDLRMDSGYRKYGEALRDHLAWFRSRWALITEFDRYRGLGDVGEMMAAKEDLRQPVGAQEPERDSWELYAWKVAEEMGAMEG